jgi:hypothetical protein
MAKPRKLQKKNPKVVWRAGDEVRAVYQTKGDDVASVIVSSAKDAALPHIRYGDISKDEADGFIKMVAKAERATDPQKAADAINAAFKEFDIAVGGGCGSTRIELAVSVDADIPDGYVEEVPFFVEERSPQYDRISLSQYARLRLKDGKTLEDYDNMDLTVVVGSGKSKVEHKVTRLSTAIKRAEAAPSGTKVSLYSGDELASKWSAKYGVFVYDA